MEFLKNKSFLEASLTILLGIIGGIASNLFSKDSLNYIEIIALVVYAVLVFCIINKGEK